MKPTPSTRTGELDPRFFALLAALMTVVLTAAGSFAAMSASQAGQLGPKVPARACRLLSPSGTTDLWSVCGDTVVDDAGEIGSFTAVGNVTIGLEPNQAPIVHIANPGGSVAASLTYGTIPLLGRKTAIVVGQVGFQEQFDVTGEFMVGSGYLIDPIDGPVSRSDVLEWDVVKGKIANTAPELHDHLDGPIGSTFDLFWADIAGTSTNFWGHELNIRDQLSMTLDLYAGRFTATIPITFSVNGNPADDLRLGLRAVFSETDLLTGGLSDFSPKVGPATLDLSNITLAKGEFEAESVELMADKNPDLAMLTDPAPPKPGLIAKFNGLKYKDRTWSIKGTTVTLRDLTLGDAVKLKQNTLGIEYQGGEVLLKIKTTLDFGDYLTSTSPITTEMRMGVVTATVDGQTVHKPYFDGGIASFIGNMGPLKFNLTNVKLQGDPANNFYGLNAQNITMQWASQFGGQSQAGLSGLKLGVDKLRKFTFAFNGGTLQSPAISTGVFSGTQFIGTVGSISNTVNMTFTGNVNIKLPGGAKDGNGNSVNPAVSIVVRAGKNVRADCNAAGAPTPCFRRIDGSLSAFSIKLAGFKLALASARPIGDGGFEVAQTTLTLPLNFGGGGQGGGPGMTINGFKMLGNGDVSITGGAITLPPLKVAGMSFGGFTGGFSTQMVNVGGQQVKAYKFVGGAKLSMPGLEPSADKSISVAATVISIPSTNEIDEVDTQLTFEAHPGIPIASSGVELTKFTGGVHFKTGAITFTLGIGVDSTARIPPTGAGIPIVSMTGNALVRPDPFSMSLGAQLKILIFNVASAQMQVGEGAGFNACPPGTPASTPASQCPRGKGFYAEFNVDALFLHGNAKIRVGKVNGVRKFAGLAVLNFGLEKGQFGFGLPRKTRTLAGITFAAGEFNVPGTSVNTTGMKGTFEIVGFDYSLFVNFNATLGSGNFVAMGHNLDDYQLVNGGAVLAAASKGVPGYATKTTFGPDAAAAPRVSIQVPLTVPHPADAYFGIHYTGTAPITPVLSLVRSCGVRCVTVITATSHNSTTIFYDEDYSPVITQGNDIGFVIKDAISATWILHVDNVPADYAIVFYVGNKPPELQHVKTGSASSFGQLTSSTLTMILTDTDSPTATLTYGYGRVDTATNTLVEGAVTPIFTTSAQGTVTYTWVLSGQVPSGVYRWVATADDGKNAPVTYYDTRNLTVTDNLAPAAPAGLAVLPLPRSIQLFWDPNTEKDLAGYEIGYGPATSPATFVYTRDMGAKEVSPAALALGKSVAMRNSADGVASVTQFDGQLWGISDGTTISVGVRAYDESGNFSAWTIVSASAWPLSPEAVSPEPDFFGDVTTIQASFSVPLKKSGLADYFELRDDGNAVVSGTVSLLYGFNDGDVVGMRFIPNAPMLPGIYVATLMGGEDGVNTPAGAYMPASYVWSWKQTNTVEPLKKVFIPVVRQ